MSADDSDDQRRKIIRRVAQLYEDAQAKHRNALEEAAEAERECAELATARLRAQAPFPQSGICPECWFFHGRKSDLKAESHPDSEHYDRLKCEHPDCGYIEDSEV